MRRTIFDTPVINACLHRLALVGLRWFGWQVVSEPPQPRKFVLIAAPHTSNWDLLVMLAVAFSYQTKIFWMGKHTLFRWPLGVFFKWLGGIPIDRSSTHDVVAQSVALFQREDELILAVPPEGTRSKTRYWKTGFYYIAKGAGVPVVMGFIDFGRKRSGIGPTLWPTGDIEADLELVRAFYADITGKYADQTSVAVIAPK